MEPIFIPSNSNRLNIPLDPNEEDFNYSCPGFESKLNIDSYETIATIGSGSYGEVCIVKDKKSTNEIYALKKVFYADVNDAELIKKRAIRERDAMIACNKNTNCRSPKLYCSFIDKNEGIFYFLMEFIGGGDLNSYCYRRIVDGKKFTMDEIKFYIAELVCILEAFHNLGFIHRDIKPENIMIDRDGHLILGDYGSSKQVHNVNHSGGSGGGSSSAPSAGTSGAGSAHWLTVQQEQSKSFGNTPPNFSSFLRNPSSSYTSYIGTPQYMAVEVVQGVVYSKLCDYWSLGAILFELITGQALFVESPDTTEQKIRENIGNWRGLLNTAISKNQPISKVEESLIRDLIAPERKRIDASGLKKHPFFEGIDWSKIQDRTQEPPFKPNLSHSGDYSYFQN